MLCGRDEDARIRLFTSHLGRNEFGDCDGLNDEITAYVANPNDNTVFLATKSLFLARYDRCEHKVLSRWNSSHSRTIGVIALNATATRLATGSNDCSIRIWHIGNCEGFVASCRCHTSKITLLRFHPTEPLLMSCSLGEVDVVVWNTETGAKVATLQGHQGNVTDIAFSPLDEQFTTCGHDKVIIVWSTKTMKRVKVIPAFESLQAMVYLPVGSLRDRISSNANEGKSYLITGGQWGIMRLWCTWTSRCVLEVRGPTSHSSDSAAASNLDFGLHSVSHLSLFHVSAFPDNPYILVLSRRSSHVEFYNAETLKLFYEFIGEIGSVDQLCLMGAARNRLVLTDVSPNLKLFSNPPSSTSSSGSWSCQLVQSPHTGVIGDMAVSSCGLWLLTGGHDQTLCLWQLVEPEESAGRLRLLSKACTKEAHDAHISAVCFARDSSAVFSASTDGVLKTWELNLGVVDKPDEKTNVFEEGRSVRNAHDGAINCVHVSSNGRFLATGSRDKTAKIWSLDLLLAGKDMQPKLIGSLIGHRRGVWSVRFSDHERVLLTASGDKDLRLWNLKDMTCIHTFEGHEEPVYRAEFISKGRQILSCDQRGLVRLWNLSKKNNTSAVSYDKISPNVVEAHQGRIWTIAVCPDNGGFYTGGEDATICFFEDKSEDSARESAATVEEFIRTHQELENLLKSKKHRRALRLAVKLDKPQRTFEILQEILFTEGFITVDVGKGSSLRPFERALFSLVPKPSAPGEAPSEEMAQRLLKYAVHWNTRARTCLVAQRVLNWVVSNWAPERLLRWPGIGHAVAAFIPYTARHYQRLGRLEEQMAVMDYLFDTSCHSRITEGNKSLENGLQLPSEQSVGVTMELDDLESSA
ncbi:Transducin beta-like protein 3 [Echinococcus granulosus]|nr:Transducin beta-like protein 3 [Echinococcus granulosus]